VKNANILLAIGATGSGKTTWLLRELHAARHARLFVFDPKRDYADALGLPIVRDWPTAARCLKALHDPRRALAVAFRYPILDERLRREQFARVCELAMQGGGMGLVIEEAALLVEPGTGNAAMWKGLVTLGARDRQISLYVATQRPALIDKTTLANCTRLRVFKLGYPEDQKVCAQALGVPVARVAALGKLEYLERNTDTGEITQGRLEFPAAPASSRSSSSRRSRTAKARAPGG
jgi:hypothetical protein